MSPAGQKGGQWQHAQVRLLQLSMDGATVHTPTPWNHKDNFYAGSFTEGTPKAAVIPGNGILIDHEQFHRYVPPNRPL
jgi:hypothetical protein